MGADQSTDFFNNLTQFVKKLNPEIKSKIKFRVKFITYLNYEKKFAEIFGKKKIDKVSYRNSLVRSILNSKLIIVTHPQTAFSEAMYSNIPTILIIEKNQCLFSKAALDTFNVLKKNKIAFEDFDEAKTHINKHWKELDLWWKSKNVQLARDMFLKNFYNVKSDWFKEWSDYIYSSLVSLKKYNLLSVFSIVLLEHIAIKNNPVVLFKLNSLFEESILNFVISKKLIFRSSITSIGLQIAIDDG